MDTNTAPPLDAIKSKFGLTGLSRAMGNVTPQAIAQWDRVPAARVLDVERITGISRHELRPDIFGVELPLRGLPSKKKAAHPEVPAKEKHTC